MWADNGRTEVAIMKQFIDNEKNAYTRPELDVIVLADNDVITASGGAGPGIVVPDDNFSIGLDEG